MLTSNSGNQYLRPEYLTPLPTTLDAKKSPLALLAQTCSQIGADAPNSKLLQTSEKASKKADASSKDKSLNLTNNDTVTHQKQMYKFHEQQQQNGREKSRTPEDRSSSVGSRVKTPKLSNGRCLSNQSAGSPRASPATSVDRKTPNSSEMRASPHNKPSNERTSPLTPTSSSGSSNSNSKTAFTPNILTSSSDPAIKDLPLGTFKPGMTPPYLGAFTAPPGFPLPVDLMTSSFMNRGFSPYMSYARLKPQDSLTSVCRDPYCTGCSVSSHLLSAKQCPAGCTQCDHTKIPTSTGYFGHNPAAAAYAHAQLAALAAASHLPYVCNWISGDSAYCGKRFANSEELLTHLRTHTSVVSEANSAALSMLSNVPPGHPLLHRTYPTPPLSPLATARFHPYSKPSLLPPSLSSSPLASFPLSHPGLSPYLSPYSIYGPRLGAAPSMHP